MNDILHVGNLKKTYDHFTLGPISFSVPEGYIMGFIGPNGAGKTTTIKAILNVIGCEAGEVTILGENNTTAPMEEVGVVLDNPLYAEEWTIGEVRRAISPFYRHWDDSTFRALMSQFRLDLGMKVKDLSRGMGVKLQIAVAFSHHAKLLILDEPTSGLDPVARDEVCDLLRGFVSDEHHSVLFSTHITSDLEKVADYITFILNGRIVFTGTTEGLLTAYVRVAGDPRDLAADKLQRIIGYTQHPTGFDGLLAVDDCGGLPSSVLTEAPSLDDIIIYMNRSADAVSPMGTGQVAMPGGIPYQSTSSQPKGTYHD